MAKPQLLLISSSAVHGYGYLELMSSNITELLKKNKVSTVVFIPYALFDYDEYTAKVAAEFTKWGFKVEGIHKLGNAAKALEKAEAIFIGGGNTFKLLKTMYDEKIMDVIRKRVLEQGIPYIGSSAGSNVATKGIHTTNDMPIVFPPSFDALGLVPFNINPHYIDADPESKHKGETREERITQYHLIPEAATVLALREDNALHVEGQTATLKGLSNARLFVPKKPTTEIKPETDLSYLLKPSK